MPWTNGCAGKRCALRRYEVFVRSALQHNERLLVVLQCKRTEARSVVILVKYTREIDKEAMNRSAGGTGADPPYIG